jgi:hypothetical protein
MFASSNAETTFRTLLSEAFLKCVWRVTAVVFGVDFHAVFEKLFEQWFWSSRSHPHQESLTRHFPSPL